jgi:hypothetical protein
MPRNIVPLQVALSALVLSACATPYIPPSGPTPPAWAGAFGVRPVPNSFHFVEGRRGPGDAVAESRMVLARTGVVAETVETKTPYGGQLLIPAGTPVFAANYTLRTNYGQIAQKTDPIEWCALLPHGKDGKRPTEETVCLFYENDHQARYMDGYGIGGYRFDPWLGTASGMAGPLPRIIEQPVDFHADIRAVVRIGKVAKGGVKFEELTVDGATSSQVEKAYTVHWDATGHIVLHIGGRTAVLTPTEDYAAVTLAVQP